MSAPPFRIIAADHTGITVTNLERSLAFWRDVLEFKFSHRTHHTATAGGVNGDNRLLDL